VNTATYTLANGEQISASNPRTFQIPDSIDRAALQPGDIVKLMFLSIDTEPRAAERMWVRVTSRVDGGYLGKLDNHPLRIKAAPGDVVKFGPEHVIAIY